jgi:hypothetical protein
VLANFIYDICKHFGLWKGFLKARSYQKVICDLVLMLDTLVSLRWGSVGEYELEGQHWKWSVAWQIKWLIINPSLFSFGF